MISCLGRHAFFLVSLRVVVMTLSFLIPLDVAFASSDEMKELEEADVKMLAEKKRIISDALVLTHSEAKNFWPVFDEYQKALDTLDDRRRAILIDYGENYDNLDDEDAKRFLMGRLKLRVDRYDLMKIYEPKFERVLPMRKLARYYHIELKIRSFIDAGIEEELPLIR